MKSMPHIFLGYSTMVDGFIYYDPISGRTVIIWDATFFELDFLLNVALTNSGESTRQHGKWYVTSISFKQIDVDPPIYIVTDHASHGVTDTTNMQSIILVDIMTQISDSVIEASADEPGTHILISDQVSNWVTELEPIVHNSFDILDPNNCIEIEISHPI